MCGTSSFVAGQVTYYAHYYFNFDILYIRHVEEQAWSLSYILLLLGVAPFSGATTGTGGRIRDVQAAGRGAHVVAGTAGYCFGNLHIPGME